MHYVKQYRVNFENSALDAAQDMLSIVMKEKGLEQEDALLSCITDENYFNIVVSGWAKIAYENWGASDPEREWQLLDRYSFTVSLDYEQERNVLAVCFSEHVSLIEAFAFFLLFEVQKLGRRI